MARKRYNDEFINGILVALGVVYIHDAETLAEEIITLVGASALLRVAKDNDDVYLPNLRKTVRFLKERQK